MIFEGHIRSTKQIATNTWEVIISHYNDLFYFNAGQYVWVITEMGRMPLSICSSSKDPHNLKFILRHRGSSQFKENLVKSEIGRKLILRGPCGSLRVPEDANKTTYIVGGVGIAPVVSIIDTIVDTNLIRSINLVFINHESGDQFYLDKLSNYLNYSNKITVTNILGRPTDEMLKKVVDEDTQTYILGRTEMVDTIYSQLLNIGISNQNIYFDENFPKTLDFSVDLNDPSLFKNVVDQSANHVVITDANGIVLYANKSVEKMTGFSFAEMKGQTPRLWGGEMEPKVYKKLWQTIKYEKKPYRAEITNIKKSGEKYDVIATISPILNKNNELLGFMGIEEDVTQNKRDRLEMEKISNLFLDKIAKE